MSRYFDEIDIEELFRIGATDFRLDPIANRVVCDTLKGAEWYMPDLPEDMPRPEYIPDRPMARLTESETADLKSVLQDIVSDDVLFRPFSEFGCLEVNQVEAFNGAIDEAWHHDGLAGKRGHAGDFFMLCYVDLSGGGGWDTAWGGAFDIGSRELGENWVHSIEAPQEFKSFWPRPRAAVIGWNGNPKLVHRAAPLQASVNRYVVAASLRLRSTAAR